MSTAEYDAEQEIMQEMDAWMDDFADRVFELSQKNLVLEGKIDTGNLLKTGNLNRQFLKKEIVYSAQYAINVHDGRARGTMPPVEPLIKWARRKLGAENPRAAGWAIAMSIKERGIQPTPFLLNALQQAKAEAQE